MSNYIGFLDFETTVEPISKTCLNCDELIRKSVDNKFKQKFAMKCEKEGHIKPRKHLCDTCKKEYASQLNFIKCQHTKLQYLRDNSLVDFETCFDCHELVLSKIHCDHSTTESLSTLNPVSYSFRYCFFYKPLFTCNQFFSRIIDNNTAIGRKTWFSKTYTGKNDAVQDFYKTLKNLEPAIYNRLQGEEPMMLSDEQEEQFEKAVHCFSCKNMFDKSDKTDKCRDHDHWTG